MLKARNPTSLYCERDLTGISASRASAYARTVVRRSHNPLRNHALSRTGGTISRPIQEIGWSRDRLEYGRVRKSSRDSGCRTSWDLAATETWGKRSLLGGVESQTLLLGWTRASRSIHLSNEKIGRAKLNQVPGRRQEQRAASNYPNASACKTCAERAPSVHSDRAPAQHSCIPCDPPSRLPPRPGHRRRVLSLNTWLSTSTSHPPPEESLLAS